MNDSDDDNRKNMREMVGNGPNPILRKMSGSIRLYS
jgi:hypothetical protein